MATTSTHSLPCAPFLSRRAGRRTLSRIAFTCFAAYNGLTGPQNLHVLAGPQARSSLSRASVVPTPLRAWSPDGAQIVFSSSMAGNPEIYVVDAQRITPEALELVQSQYCQRVTGLEPEDRPEHRLRQRPRRYSQALSDEFRWHKLRGTRSSGQGLPHRSVLVAQRPGF